MGLSFMEILPERNHAMNLVNFLVWLLAGALIGWFASQMVEAEKRRFDRGE